MCSPCKSVLKEHRLSLQRRGLRNSKWSYDFLRTFNWPANFYENRPSGFSVETYQQADEETDGNIRTGQADRCQRAEQKEGQIDGTMQGRLKSTAFYEPHRSGVPKRLIMLQTMSNHEYFVSVP
jgi:hypothetical protein